MIELLSSRANVEETWSLWKHISRNISDYKELLKALRNAQEGDVINIDIHSSGGSCEVGFKIIEHIKESKAVVNCIVSGDCYSMGTLIALAGDSLTMKRHTFLMFHTFSYGIGHQKSGDVSKYVENTDKLMRILGDEIATPFLTDKEIREMHDGKDIYIWWNDESLQKRIRRHYR